MRPREKTEGKIDNCVQYQPGSSQKALHLPRQSLVGIYLKIANQKKPQNKATRKAIGKLRGYLSMGYLSRNIKTTD